MAQAPSHGVAMTSPTGTGHAQPVHHGGPATYVAIFVVLFLITAAEVAVTYFPELPQVPVLLALAAAKGILIVLFYMHLKYDSRIFTMFFVIGMVIALSMIITFMGIFLGSPRSPFHQEAPVEQAGAAAAAH